jgi:hypothetical protein
VECSAIIVVNQQRQQSKNLYVMIVINNPFTMVYNNLLNWE